MKYIFILFGILAVGSVLYAQGVFSEREPLINFQKTSMTFEGNFLDLLQRDGNFSCDFDQEHPNGSIVGTIHLKDGRLRADHDFMFETQQDFTGHLIVKDGYMYTWSEIPSLPKTFGIRVPYEHYEQSITDPQAAQSWYRELAKRQEFTCVRRTVDDSYFELPAHIEFKDIDTNAAQ